MSAKPIRRTVPVFVPECRNGSEPWAGTVELFYLPADPFAVHMLIEKKRWAFLRDMVADGLEGQVGIGDVRIRPLDSKGERRVEVVLSSPDGRAVLWLSRSGVAGLLAAAYKAVPRGHEHEHLDWDATVAALLAKDGSR